ncbi:hypothetical protein CP083_04955 [Candidatus Bathyarchaeota archaeon B24-2]|nr:MAG: hypothetical protein CP083_04955 [Candidatus Bathyarchaeota archaeon B24-2]
MLNAGALVLAGGESRRIGGFKALAELNGKPLILYVVEKAVKLFVEVVVVASSERSARELKKILPRNVRVVEDSVDGRGPLVGIVSGAREVSSEYMATLPCDSPFIKIEVLNILYGMRVGFDAVIPRWPNGYIEPLHAIYRRKTALSAGLQALKTGRYRVAEMIRRLGKVRYVDIEDFRKVDAELLTFFNINSIEDLRRAEDIVKARLHTSFRDR